MNIMIRQNVQPSAALICLAAWLLAALTQHVFVLTLPPGKAIALGVDISHAAHLVLLTQAFYVTCGLALAVAACVLRQRPRGLLRGCSFARVSWTILALLLGSVPHAIGATRGERRYCKVRETNMVRGGGVLLAERRGIEG